MLCCGAPQFKAVKPVGDRVLVKVDKEEMKSIGGVLLPANAAKKPTAGSIVGMGDVCLVKVSTNWERQMLRYLMESPWRRD